MKGQKTRFHQKDLHLCSEDERKSYLINDRIFIFGWTNPSSSTIYM